MVSKSPLTAQLPPELQVTEDDDFTEPKWAEAMYYLVQRFKAIESFEPSFQEAVDQLNQFGLERLNDIIQPVYNQLTAIANLGAIFTATSQTPFAVSTGLKSFVIDNTNSAWQTFAPAQYMTAYNAASNITLSGFVQSFDRTSGTLVLSVMIAAGAAGTYTGWTLSPSSPATVGGTIDGGDDVALTRIKLRRSKTGTAPAATDLMFGELLLDTLNGVMYWKDSTSTVRSTVFKDLATNTALNALAALVTGLTTSLATTNSNVATNTSSISANALALTTKLELGASQSVSSAMGNQGRFNLGKPAGLKLSSGTTSLNALSGLEKECEFTGTATLLAPLGSSVFDDWRTGIITNRGNGSAATATFIGTVGVQTGDYLNGTLNGTVTVAYAQKGYLVYDALAPTPTWRWIYLDRTPLISAINVPAGSGAAALYLPPGYDSFDFSISYWIPSVNGATLNARISADGGTTIRQGATDYSVHNLGGTTTVAAAGASQSSIVIMQGQANGVGGYGRGQINRQGQILMHNTGANSSGVSFDYLNSGMQGSGSAWISPNYVLLYPSSGTFSCTDITVKANH